MKYLIDTNILIYLCNSKSEKLERRFRRHKPEDFYVSAITVAELIYGVNKSQKKDQNLHSILKILSPFTVIDFDSSDGWEYGAIRAELEALGKVIGSNDMLIAAQARRRKLIVLTNNVKEYTRIENLKVENWV